MKSKKKMAKILLLTLPLVVGIAIADATPEETPCAIFVKVGKGIQVIPKEGHVQTKIVMDHPVSCGSMVITHQESAWVKLSNQTIVKLGPETFIEIPRVKSQSFHLYRGELLLSAPASMSAQVWSTPNSETEFKGGVAWLQYLSSEKKSTVGSFNRSVKFINKFNSGASQEVHAGEMSHLAIQEAHVKPSQPGVMSHLAVTEAMNRLKLTEEESKQFVAIVKQVYEDRSGALASEIEEWGDDDGSEEPSRSIASVPQSAKKAVDEKEAEFTLKMLRNRLFGATEEVAKVENTRVPASVKPQLKADELDSERVVQKKKLQGEVKRISKEIDAFRPESIE